MEMLNRAIEGVADYKDMMRKIADVEGRHLQEVRRAIDSEVTAWNAEVDRKRAEKKARKAQHVAALEALRK